MEPLRFALYLHDSVGPGHVLLPAENDCPVGDLGHHRSVGPGRGPRQAVLHHRDSESLAVRLGAESEFTGGVLREAEMDLLGSCEAAAPYPPASPSNSAYFSPRKVYKDTSAARPIIATSTGQIPFPSRSGHTGSLVAAGDGEIVEEGRPGSLLADPDSRFARWVERQRAKQPGEMFEVPT